MQLEEPDMKKLKNTEWMPIAIIVVILIIVVVLCVTGRQKKTEQTEESSVNTEAEESTGETEPVYGGEVPLTGETATEMESVTENTAREKENTGEAEKKDGQNGASMQISANHAAETMSVQKSHLDMMDEMLRYWSENKMDAVDDLMELEWYQKMSDSLTGKNTFYYYGTRNQNGMPDGVGIAVYEGNQYYYGEWENGKRNGTGKWIEKYVYEEDDTTSDRAYRLHLYQGEWKNDKPNGEGQEHFELDMTQASDEERYIQNVIGTFKDGCYDGDMYVTTLNRENSSEEWNGIGVVVDGKWTPYGAEGSKKDIMVLVNTENEEDFIWMEVNPNKGNGISELMD